MAMISSGPITYVLGSIGSPVASGASVAGGFGASCTSGGGGAVSGRPVCCASAIPLETIRTANVHLRTTARILQPPPHCGKLFIVQREYARVGVSRPKPQPAMIDQTS